MPTIFEMGRAASLFGISVVATSLADSAGTAQTTTTANLPRDAARAITSCWHPPHEGDEITLRMSFRRDGSVFGKPRITYMKAAGGPDAQAALANSIFAAIAACTPLRLTPSLGAAIAGRIFLIRFVALR